MFLPIVIHRSIPHLLHSIIIIQLMINPHLCYFPVWPFTTGKWPINPYNPPCFDTDSHFVPKSWTLKLVTVPFRVERNGFLDPKLCPVYVEKPQFSFVLISSCAFFKSKIACLHVSFTTYEYFYKLSKSASFSRWLLHPVTQKNQ